MGFSQFFDSFGAINNDGVEYYAERAKGGFGMLVVGGMPVDLDVEGYDPRWCENPLYAPTRFISRASVLNERCAAYGTKCFAELISGSGRNSIRGKAPSAVEVFEHPADPGLDRGRAGEFGLHCPALSNCSRRQPRFRTTT